MVPTNPQFIQINADTQYRAGGARGQEGRDLNEAAFSRILGGMKLKLLLILILALCASSAPAVVFGEKSATAVRFPDPPEIDGQVIEDVWELASPLEGMIQFVPHNGRPSDLRTVVKFGFDDEALYVSFVCYDPAPDGIASALTRRDSDLGYDDCVGIFLDTLDDNQTGTAFVTNLLGTQWDFRISDNGRASHSNWDATWYSAAARTEEGWSAEYRYLSGF
jgi:hypothetical protein